MAIPSAAGAPFRARIAGDVLYLVQRVLDERFERLAGLHVAPVVEVQAGVDREDRLHLQFFAPLEELQQPEKTLPRALTLGTISVAVLYALLNLLFIYATPLEQMKGVLRVGSQASERLFGVDVAAPEDGMFDAKAPCTRLPFLRPCPVARPRPLPDKADLYLLSDATDPNLAGRFAALLPGLRVAHIAATDLPAMRRILPVLHVVHHPARLHGRGDCFGFDA